MKNLFSQKNKGFTLIELLVVIAIIGILAAVVLVSLNSARSKSRDARRLADVRQVMTAVELFYNDNNRYPTANGNAATPTDGSPAFSTFLSTWPIAPTPADNPAGSSTCTAANNAYVYASPAGNATYTLAFCLGTATGGYAAGTHTASPSGIQ